MNSERDIALSDKLSEQLQRSEAELRDKTEVISALKTGEELAASAEEFAQTASQIDEQIALEARDA